MAAIRHASPANVTLLTRSPNGIERIPAIPQLPGMCGDDPRHGKGEARMFLRKYFAAILVGSLISAASILPAAAGTYGALSAGFWKDENGALHVTSGTAKNFSSPERATDAANEACFAQGRNCHVVSTFSNGGCGFISVGHNGDFDALRNRLHGAKGFRQLQGGRFRLQSPQGRMHLIRRLKISGLKTRRAPHALRGVFSSAEQPMHFQRARIDAYSVFERSGVRFA